MEVAWEGCSQEWVNQGFPNWEMACIVQINRNASKRLSGQVHGGTMPAECKTLVAGSQRSALSTRCRCMVTPSVGPQPPVARIVASFSRHYVMYSDAHLPPQSCNRSKHESSNMKIFFKLQTKRDTTRRTYVNCKPLSLKLVGFQHVFQTGGSDAQTDH